jgi:hypothetical protein
MSKPIKNLSTITLGLSLIGLGACVAPLPTEMAGQPSRTAAPNTERTPVVTLMDVGICTNAAARYRHLPVAIPEEAFQTWEIRLRGIQTRPLKKGSPDDNLLCIALRFKNPTSTTLQFPLRQQDVTLMCGATGVPLWDVYPCGLFNNFPILAQVRDDQSGGLYPDGSQVVLMHMIEEAVCILQPGTQSFLILFFIAPPNEGNAVLNLQSLRIPISMQGLKH